MPAASPTPAAAGAHRRAVALLAFCALLWSTAGVGSRHLESAASFEVTFWRSLFAALGVLGWLAWQAGGSPVRALAPLRRAGVPGLFIGVMWAVMFTCFMIALTRTSVANTLLVLSISPLLAALLGWAVLREPIRGATWLAIAAAGFGIWWMVREGVSADGLAGMAIALGVPVAAATNVVLLKRVHASIDAPSAVLIGGVLSCAATLPFAMPFAASASDLVILALLGFFQLALPCVLMVRAVPHLAPHEVALIALLEVVLGPVWAWLGAGEAIAPATIQGGVIVLGALALNAWLQRTSPRPA